MKVELYEKGGTRSQPISVVVTHSEGSEPRRSFLYDYCLPSVKNCFPAEVILVTGPESAGAKRNAGAAKATSEYLVLWDDDCIMATGYTMLISALVVNPEPSFAYCDALEIVHPDAPPGPFSGVRVRKSKPWDPGALRRANYISNMSVMRRAHFPGCDEKLKRLVDYDMWLTMVSQGRSGIYVPGQFYHAYYLDRGITAGATSYEEALRAVRAKRPKG